MIVGSALILPSWSSPSGSEAGREDTMAGSKLAPSSIRERERGVRAGSQGGIRDGGGLGEREGRGGEGRGKDQGKKGTGRHYLGTPMQWELEAKELSYDSLHEVLQ